MCADRLPTKLINSPSTECGVTAVLLALVRKMGLNVYLFVHACQVRGGMICHDHKSTEDTVRIIDPHVRPSMGTEVRYFFHASVERGRLSSLRACTR